MEMRQALKEQYHGGLTMLAECVERCPEELWHDDTDRRTFSRIAFHAAFFAHLYLGQNEGAVQHWPGRREDVEWALDRAEGDLYYRRDELLGYLRFVDGLIDPTVDLLDLDSDETGFPWYPNMTKLSHELMNLRHIQGHVGQLSERLMARGIDTGWVGKAGAGNPARCVE